MKTSARQAVGYMVVFVLLSFIAQPVWGASKKDDEKTLLNAVTVLQAMTHTKDVPHSVIAKADCIVILPSVKKFAVGVGGTGGRGPMSCRMDNYTGKWSAPAMYTIGGASAGLQIGGTATDYILLFMTSGAADKALNGKIKVGSDATAALGPGASAGNSFGGADILTYSRTSGAFAGVSLNGATLDPDNDANKRLYDKEVTPKEIGSVTPTPGGKSLMSVLDSSAGKKE
jgi:lipid-binding SYLF domain-containing protein